LAAFAPERSLIYVVLGMHKSGTTLVSQILHHSGISMGEIDTRRGYDDSNQYEDQESLHLNMELIRAPDYEVLYIPPPPELVPTVQQRERMRRFIADRSVRHADWGFKDPRTTLVYPLWAEELPEHRLIAVWRAPEEIWPRFAAPGPRLWYQEPKRAWNFVLRWCEHNRLLVKHLRETPRDYLLLNYGDFMSGDGEFRRLESFIGKPLVDQRRKELYRGKRRRYPSHEIAKGLVKWRTGNDPDEVARELLALPPERRLIPS
jgi:hypothetical protein